jgi:hypothetical protein
VWNPQFVYWKRHYSRSVKNLRRQYQYLNQVIVCFQIIGQNRSHEFFPKFWKKLCIAGLWTLYKYKWDFFRNQFSFRKNHSTSHALINLYDQISTGLDANKHTVGIFLDLSKAINTVDHEILINKLEHYGIRGLALDWFKNYLSHRLQYVEFNGTTSMFKEVTCGVPQGSILGPLLFLIYINDICKTTDYGNMILMKIYLLWRVW